MFGWWECCVCWQYELLDEIMDFGFPQFTEAKILGEFIKTLIPLQMQCLGVVKGYDTRRMKYLLLSHAVFYCLRDSGMLWISLYFQFGSCFGSNEWNIFYFDPVGPLPGDHWKKWIPGSCMGEIHNNGWRIWTETNIKPTLCVAASSHVNRTHSCECRGFFFNTTTSKLLLRNTLQRYRPSIVLCGRAMAAKHVQPILCLFLDNRHFLCFVSYFCRNHSKKLYFRPIWRIVGYNLQVMVNTNVSFSAFLVIMLELYMRSPF